MKTKSAGEMLAENLLGTANHSDEELKGAIKNQLPSGTEVFIGGEIPLQPVEDLTALPDPKPESNLILTNCNNCGRAVEVRAINCPECSGQGFKPEAVNGIILNIHVVEPKEDLSPLERELILLDKIYSEELKPLLERFKEVKESLLKERGAGYMFQSSEGIVYEVCQPEGKFVYFEKAGYNRTRRAGERAGTLSIKKAQETGFDGIPDFKEPKEK
jgi:hypothetical protein